MRGSLQRRTWQYDPALYAPARYRKACAYDAFIPEPVAAFADPIGAETAAAVSDAETAIHALNARARPALAPLARLLLRTESIASSKVEGMQIDGRDLARAEARAETGGKTGARCPRDPEQHRRHGARGRDGELQRGRSPSMSSRPSTGP